MYSSPIARTHLTLPYKRVNPDEVRWITRVSAPLVVWSKMRTDNRTKVLEKQSLHMFEDQMFFTARLSSS